MNGAPFGEFEAAMLSAAFGLVALIAFCLGLAASTVLF